MLIPHARSEGGWSAGSAPVTVAHSVGGDATQGQAPQPGVLHHLPENQLPWNRDWLPRRFWSIGACIGVLAIFFGRDLKRSRTPQLWLDEAVLHQAANDPPLWEWEQGPRWRHANPRDSHEPPGDLLTGLANGQCHQIKQKELPFDTNSTHFCQYCRMGYYRNFYGRLRKNALYLAPIAGTFHMYKVHRPPANPTRWRRLE